jgi:hypothetical protein
MKWQLSLLIDIFPEIYRLWDRNPAAPILPGQDTCYPEVPKTDLVSDPVNHISFYMIRADLFETVTGLPAGERCTAGLPGKSH